MNNIFELLFWFIFIIWITIVYDWIKNDLFGKDNIERGFTKKEYIIMMMSYYIGFNYEYVVQLINEIVNL